MKYNWIDAYLMQKPGVHKDYKAEWGWDRYMIDGKLFAAVCYNEEHKPYYITLKLDPAESELLRSQYEDIIPGYYMNKLHWSSVKADGAVPDEVLQIMLDHAWHCLLDGFSKKRRMEITGEE